MAERVHTAPGHPPIEIDGVTADSRQVKPGFLFAALPGAKADGSAFIGEAIRRGARAILAPQGTVLPAGHAAIDLITDANPRRRLALIAADFYHAQPKTVVQVTGTNGKTSVAWFTAALWQAAGNRSASLGTLGLKADGLPEEPGLTTPEPVALHARLARLAGAGITHLAMEASSHGLEQRRLDGVRIAAAGFTNLSRDHLDYHGTEAAYFAAKARLFEEVLQPGGTAVLHADIPQAEPLSAIAKRRDLRLVRYGMQGKELRLLHREARPNGALVRLEAYGQVSEIELPLIGAFQTANALCALGLAGAVMDDPSRLVPALAGLKSVPGRLDYIGLSARGGAVYVDYAHTPDALRTVLTALREHTEGALAVVFGCGGDRDAGKRPLMGQASATLADRVIVTDDNPRTEDPAAIRKAALAGTTGATGATGATGTTGAAGTIGATGATGAREIGDRAEAIAAAIDALRAGDVLVIAGKGHEPYQIIGETALPFDDRAVARAALLAGGGRV